MWGTRQKLLIVLMFQFAVCHSSFAQFFPRYDEETEESTLFYGEEQTDISIQYISDFDYFLASKEGKKAFLPPGGTDASVDELLWFDDYKLFEDWDDEELFYMYYVQPREEGKIGLINFWDQQVLLSPVYDSLLIDEYSGDGIFLYQDGSVTYIPLRMLYGDFDEQQLGFYDSLFRVEDYLGVYPRNEQTFVVSKNNKLGLLEYRSTYIDSLERDQNEIIELTPQNLSRIEMGSDWDELIFVEGPEGQGVYGDYDFRPVLMPVYDSVSFFEGYLLYEKDGLKGADYPYNLKDSLPETKYAEVYFDDNMYELVKIPSVDFFKSKYPELINISQLEETNLLLFEGKNGDGVYSNELDKLLIEMEYDEIIPLDYDNLQLKKGDYYAQAYAQEFDYAFVGYDENLFFIYDRPVIECTGYSDYHTFVTTNDGDSIWFKGTTSPTFSHPELPYYYQKSFKEVIDVSLPPAEQFKQAVKFTQGMESEIEVAALFETMNDFYEKMSFGGKKLVAFSYTTQNELDSIFAMYFDSVPIMNNHYILAVQDTYEGSSINPARIYFDGVGFKNWDGINFTLYHNGKSKSYERISVHEDGWLVAYKKGKGVLLNQEGKKLKKLKRWETLVDIQSGYYLMEEWHEGDTVLTMKVYNPKGDVIFSKKYETSNSDYPSYNSSLQYMLKNNLRSNYGPSAPVSFWNVNNDFLLEEVRTGVWDEANGMYRKNYYSKDGTTLKMEGVDEYLLAGYVKTVYTTPRAILYGLLNGDKWLIEPKYDELDELSMYTSSGREESYIRTGLKGVYALYDQKGKELLPAEYHYIELEEVYADQLALKVVKKGNTKPETIVIDK